MAKKRNTLIWVGLGTLAAGGIGWFIFKRAKAQDVTRLPAQAARAPKASSVFPSNVLPAQTVLSRRTPIEPPPSIKSPGKVTYTPLMTLEQRKAKKRRVMLERKKAKKKAAMLERGRRKVVIPGG